MNKNKLPGILLAIFGLTVAIGLLYGAIRFYHTISEITANNPSLNPAPDTLRLNMLNDTLVDYNSGLNQKIAEQLNDKNDAEKNRKQVLLHQSINNFIHAMDTLQTGNFSHEQQLVYLKNCVNKTNLACRAALFNINDAGPIAELDKFIITDEKNLDNTIFECFSKKEILIQCFEKIKHDALYLEKIILEKNFNQLNL